MAEPLPARVKRTLWRGDTRPWTHVFTQTDENGDDVLDEAGNPVPVDLTGHTFISQFRSDRDRGAVLAEAVCTVTDPEGGTVTEVLSAAEASNLPGQTANTNPKVYWDLQSTDASGNVRTWLYADVPVRGDRSHEEGP